VKICLSTNHLLRNTVLGGHAWVFLNWALGLQECGHEVVFLESLGKGADLEGLPYQLAIFQRNMRRLGLEAELCVLLNGEQEAALGEDRDAFLQLVAPLDYVAETSDLLLNFRYTLGESVVHRFARSALVDIDPGLLQQWMHDGQIDPATHDAYVTIGETVETPGSKIPKTGLAWIYTPPPVHLASWEDGHPAEAGAPYTTVTNWWGKREVFDGETINNEKRHHFIECLDLPSRVSVPLELAIYHEDGQPSDMPMLREHGWRARPAREVSASAAEYRKYIQASRGEFSCAKPSCMYFQNAWISDRTICYLASGRPAIVQNTGPSRILDGGYGLLRFDTPAGAAAAIQRVEDDYEDHCAAAWALAQERFGAEDLLPELLDKIASARSGRT